MVKSFDKKEEFSSHFHCKKEISNAAKIPRLGRIFNNLRVDSTVLDAQKHIVIVRFWVFKVLLSMLLYKLLVELMKLTACIFQD